MILLRRTGYILRTHQVLLEADAMLASNGYIYYGLYNKPYFQRKEISTGVLSDLIDLQSYINDDAQIRVWCFAVYQQYIFMGTYARDNDVDSKAAILRYDTTTQEITLVGKVDAAHINSLSIAPYNNLIGGVLIYGATLDGVFVYAYSNGLSHLKPEDTLIPVNKDPKIHYGVFAVLYDNTGLYVAYNKWQGWRRSYIRRYDNLPISNQQFGTLNYSETKLSDYAIGNAGILKGNDGYIYLYWNSTDGVQPNVDLRSKLYKISPTTLTYSTIYGSDIPVVDQSQVIYRMAIDGFDNSNKSVYLGFLNGSLRKSNVNAVENKTSENNINLDNYPNPFNPTTKITYYLNSDGYVSLKIYDILGREIASLINEVQKSGPHTINFNGSNLSAGVYIYSLRTLGHILSKKMLLLK